MLPASLAQEERESRGDSYTSRREASDLGAKNFSAMETAHADPTTSPAAALDNTRTIQAAMHAVRMARLAREQKALSPLAGVPQGPSAAADAASEPPLPPSTYNGPRRRAYLIAKHDIPANVELTWDPLPTRSRRPHVEKEWLLDTANVKYDASLVGQRVHATFLDEDGVSQWYPALIVEYRPEAEELKYVIHFDEDGEEIEADLPDESVQLLMSTATHCKCPTCIEADQKGRRLCPSAS